MAKFSQLMGLGKKFGSKSTDFTTQLNSTAEQVMIDWSNEGIELMRQQIIKTSKSRGQSTLAQSFYIKPTKGGVEVRSESDAFDYVDKGVRGLSKNKAPKSPYRFRSFATPKTMIESFKKWAASAGITSVNGTTPTYKGKSRKKAKADQTKVAKQLATFTKLGGIRPHNFISKAVNKKRVAELNRELTIELGEAIKINILNGNYDT